MSKKVSVEVEEGSRIWAMAMHDAGGRVEVEYPDAFKSGRTYWMVQNPHASPEERGEREGTSRLPPVRDVWRLHVEPPQPITVQPGTFPWAIAKAGWMGRIKRRSEGDSCGVGSLLKLGSTIVDFEATDWEVVE